LLKDFEAEAKSRAVKATKRRELEHPMIIKKAYPYVDFLEN